MKILSGLIKSTYFVFVFLGLPLIIVWVGYSQIWPLFTGEFTQQLGSIEVSYIQMAKFISSSWPRLAWQPRWYLGYPMSVLYTPFVPVFEFVSHNLWGWSYSHAYRWLTAFSYVGGLVTLYLFTRTWFKNTAAGYIAALIYGILPSFMGLLYPEIALDRFLVDLVEPRRFTILVRWGEGPHVVSLMFLPLAALFLIKFLRRGNKWQLLFGSVFTALVLLTNSVGAWGLLLLSFAVVFGELTENPGRWQQVLGRSLIFAAVSFGLSAFWFNPLFLATFFHEGGGAWGFWKNQFPWGWLLGGAILAIYFFLSKKLLGKIFGVSGSLLFLGMMFGLVNTYYGSGSERLELVPQVLRLTTEVDIAVALAVGGVISAAGFILSKMHRNLLGLGMVVVIIAGSILMGGRQLRLISDLPRFAEPAEKAGIKLEQTAEYEIAKVLETKVKGQERVFVPGNYGFYLNYFTDLPQLRGALFQSAVNPWPDHIYFQTVNGLDADITLDWLKIANVGWFVFSGPRETFHDFKVDESKFAAVLKFDEDRQGDKIYQVPLKDTSLTKAVPQAILSVKIPINAIDRTPIAQYVGILESSRNQLQLVEKNNGVYEITGNVGDGELVLVQMAYAPGWQARDKSGQGLVVSKDPLGMIAIKPKQTGAQNIDLIYGVSGQVMVGWLATLTMWVFCGLIIFKFKSPMIEIKPKMAAKENVEEEIYL